MSGEAGILAEYIKERLTVLGGGSKQVATIHKAVDDLADLALARAWEQVGTAPLVIEDPERERLEHCEAALQRILDWSAAYPLSVFPEPDLNKAHMILRDHGMTLDAISASAIRHVLAGVAGICREALQERWANTDEMGT
jgi:hypothetical protein